MSKRSTSRIGWYVNRLLSMDPGEIIYRLSDQVELWRERSAVNRPTHGYSPYPIPAGIFSQFKDQSWPQFFYSHDRETALRKEIQDQFPDGVQSTMKSANQILKNQITFFGRTMTLDNPINWFKDPLTNNVWPKEFWGTVDIRDGKRVGGVKWVRELNRHHHFVTLGKAYWLSGDEKFAAALCSQFSSWIETNPPFVGVNWSSALGNAIRVINWLWALNFIHDSPALTEDLFNRIITAIAAQTDFIGRHLSRYSSANNHLIGEAAGLAFVGLTLPWLRQAKKWQEQGLAILTEEIEKQIYPDGVMAEQAVSYLAFDLDFYLLVWRAAVLRNFSIPEIWQERLKAACHFISHIMDENGHVPAIGDSDDGRVLDLDERLTANRFRSILAAAAVLLKRPEFKSQAGEWDEKNHWLLGEDGRIAFQALEKRPPAQPSTAFKDGGYVLMRRGDRQILFDCGPLGYLSLAAHGHADTLSLLLSVGGQPILIDSGTYAYREGGEWRRFFRGTSAHNTIVIDGQDQSEMRGDFLWGQRASSRLLVWEPGEEYDLCTAEHDGYSTLNITHRRTVLFYKPDWLLIIDSLAGEGNHEIVQNWHFPIQSQIDKLSGHFIVKVNNSAVQILTEDSTYFTSRILMGEDNPIQGWISEQYGHKKPAPVLSISGTCSAPLVMTTLINLGKFQEMDGLISCKKQLLQIARQP